MLILWRTGSRKIIDQTTRSTFVLPNVQNNKHLFKISDQVEKI